jgi:hypothetical protein
VIYFPQLSGYLIRSYSRTEQGDGRGGGHSGYHYPRYDSAAPATEFQLTYPPRNFAGIDSRFSACPDTRSLKDVVVNTLIRMEP